jgi:hypothetical protein
MCSYSLWTALANFHRSGHLSQRHHELIALGAHLRTAMAQAIGRAVAGVACQSVLSLLGTVHADLSPRRPPSLSPRSPSLWQTPYEGNVRDHLLWRSPSTDLEQHRVVEVSGFRPPLHLRTGVLPAHTWYPGLAVIVQAVAWWFWRQVGRSSVCAALGFGLALALALWLNGSVASNVAGLAPSLLTDALAPVKPA